MQIAEIIQFDTAFTAMAQCYGIMRIIVCRYIIYFTVYCLSPFTDPKCSRATEGITECKRIMLTKEKRRQKDFFEKEKLKSKMKLLGVSPLKSSAVSLDLLNLYVVNQISARKDNTDNIRKPVHVEINRGIKHTLRRYNVELPKSPECRSSKPFLDDVQYRVQQEVIENRQKYLLEKENFKSQCLQASQLTNTKCEDLWLSKAGYRQTGFNERNADRSVDLSFQQMNGLEYSSIFSKSPKFTADTDFGSNHQEDTLKDTQGESSHPIATLFEEKNQQFLTIPVSQSCHSFAKKPILDQLFTDSGDANQISSMHGPYDNEEMHEMTCSVQRYSAERDLQGIFTAPEQILFPNSQSLNAVNQKTIKNQMKDYYLKERNNVICTDQQENTIDVKNTGVFENKNKNMKVAETIQNYFKKWEDGLTESNLNHLQIFALEETEKESCSYYDQHSKQSGGNGYGSQLSSQSPTYSPKQTERCANSTSDESEEEEQDEKASYFFEDRFPRNDGKPLAVRGSQRAQCPCQSMSTYSVFLESVSRETANIPPQTKPAMGLRKDMPCRAGKDVLDVSCENKYVNFKARNNAWSQTESYGIHGIKKRDAAIQCNILQVCGCKNGLASVLSAEIVCSTSKVETTGGQNIPADRAALQPSSS
ncbi:uncharacterized protein C12orf40 homolog isoform X2 [Sceloporus undulatus]|uniref:uncharacterized protein C12orf40 homolog isoform X2 n=1 Tax=Sceloporus undulatus TaxID=8520 RepID=UPI001C4DB2D5|nr:uncharacterized protein C12orf40 homolog isoform X2 [Sceloporus undulatus]